MKRVNLSLWGAYAAVGLLIVCAIAPHWLASYSPSDMLVEHALMRPGAEHWLGTDYFGRDILSLIVHGSRESLFIGFLSVLLGSIAGLLIGLVSGYAGGMTDTLLMRGIDLLMAIPGILLALGIAAALGPGFWNMVLAIGVSTIPTYARVVRGQVSQLKTRTYVLASRSLGGSSRHIAWHHILPGSMQPLLVMATLGLGNAILAGASLSFLGLGTMKEIPDWGTLLAQGRAYLSVGWWISTFPGLTIAVFVLGINIIGDAWRDRTAIGNSMR